MKRGGIKNYLCQADPSRDLVGDVLPVDVSYPRARDVLHPTTTHPYLQKNKREGFSEYVNL